MKTNSTSETVQKPGFDWSQITKYNFSYACEGGAWLEDSNGHRNWFNFATIREHMGQEWIDRQNKAQGWMTGCWSTCV